MPSGEDPPVTPRRDFGLECGANADQVEAGRETCESDVVCRVARTGIAEEPFAGIDGFKPRFERDQIPFGAMGADDPQAAEGGVEGKAPTHRLAAEYGIFFEIVGTVETGAVHRRPPNGSDTFPQEVPSGGWQRAGSEVTRA